MTFETGLEEIALENLQASKSALRKDDLPTRDEVAEVIYQNQGWRGHDAVTALIVQGWLKVKGGQS